MVVAVGAWILNGTVGQVISSRLFRERASTGAARGTETGMGIARADTVNAADEDDPEVGSLTDELVGTGPDVVDVLVSGLLVAVWTKADLSL